MPKLIHNVTIEFFSRGASPTIIDPFVPIPLQTILQEQFKWHPERPHTKIYDLPKKGVSLWVQETDGDEGIIIVYHYRFSKQRDTNAFKDKLQQLDRSERQKILDNIDKHLDSKGRLQLRFSLDSFSLVESGECLMVKINLAAFPKNAETCKHVAMELLQ